MSDQYQPPSAVNPVPPSVKYFQAVDSGGYVVRGVPLKTTVSAEPVWGYQPLFTVHSSNLTVAAPGTASKSATSTRDMVSSTADPDTGTPSGDGTDLLVPRAFNAAGSDLTIGSGVLTSFTPSQAGIFRMDAQVQFELDPAANTTGSSIGLAFVVTAQGTYTQSRVGRDDQALVPVTLGNRISVGADVYMTPYNPCTLAVTWNYSDSPLTIKKIVWSCSKMLDTVPVDSLEQYSST